MGKKAIKSFSLLMALLLAVALFPACNSKQRYSRDYLGYFDTSCIFTAYCTEKSEFDSAADKLDSEMERLHRLFDVYNEYEGINNLKTVNDNAGKAPVTVENELISLAEYGKKYYEMTNGTLNIAMGSVLRLWHEALGGGAFPTDDQLKSAGEHCNIEKLIITEDTLYLEDSAMSVDVGAIAKGYAAEYLAKFLKDEGMESFALNLGGNVITVGEKPEGKWKIGIKNPEGDGNSAVLSVSDTSVVTSGDYERYIIKDGVRYNHIISSETLYPSDNFRSVTVVCKNSLLADALSTSLFCMSLEDGKALAKKSGADIMWILPSGDIVRTEGFSEYE